MCDPYSNTFFLVSNNAAQIVKGVAGLGHLLLVCVSQEMQPTLKNRPTIEQQGALTTDNKGNLGSP